MSGAKETLPTATLHVGTAAQGRLRWALTDLTPLVEEARLLRDLSPLAAIGLGQLLSASVLLTRLISKEPLRLAIEVNGSGPLGRVRAEADTQGRVRGLVERRRAERGDEAERGAPRLGEGSLRILRQLPSHNHDSRVSLVEGGVAQNIAHFLEQSEQIRSAVLLGVMARSTGVVAGGGLIVEALPGADSALIRRIEERIDKIPSVASLLEGEGAWGLLGSTLGEVEYKSSEQRQLILDCECSPERFRLQIRALLRQDPTILGDDEKTEVQCQFCGAEYAFATEELLPIQ